MHSMFFVSLPVRSFAVLLFLITAGSAWPARALDETGQDEYSSRIKPLLRARCYSCHGVLKQRAGLRLDTVAFMVRGGKSGPVVRAGDADTSRLVEKIAAVDPADRMPPAHEGDPLTSDQIAMVRRWIAAGASAPAAEQPESDPRDHWSFRPISRPDLPASTDWTRNPIDALLTRQHAIHHLTPQVEAPRIVLVRRLYLDLIGVPPTLEEISACQADQSSDWYERLVDRLLDDPRHGERWGRHWMDIWRYSDWWGLGDQLRNSQKHIWHWRDWIIESLNGDVPYDEMVRLMLAADELDPTDLNKLRATGFLARNWFLFNRHQWLEETVEHVGKGFLGLTFNCAKCHDHKYDPVEQADFYRMRAFFEPYHVRMDMVPGEADLARNGIPRPFDGMLDEPTYLFVRGDEKQPDKSAEITPGVPAIFGIGELQIAPVALPAEAWQPERRAWVVPAYLEAAEEKVRAADAELDRERTRLDDARRAEAGWIVLHGQSVHAFAALEEFAISPCVWSVVARGPWTGKKGPDPLASASAVRIEACRRFAVAEAASAVAVADRESIQQRAAAMQAGWVDPVSDAARRQAAMAAIAAERKAAVARARRAVADAELAAVRAKDDKKEAATSEIEKARTALKDAENKAAAPIADNDQFTKLTGAAWTPTRFFNSSQDDPAVPFPPHSTGRRSALARWITHPKNPLTARVAANHIWTRHMNEPLVATVFDFGRNGARPVLPELLDWLAAELMDHGWSMKQLHRTITTSAAYRMSSSVRGRDGNVAKDPDNRFCWRRSPLRLESQVVRDSILALAGTLDSTMGGPPVPRDQQQNSSRRSLYFFHSNNERNLFLATFDEALVKDCYRRDQSVVPQQALALTNSALVLDAADRIARRLGGDVSDDAEFLRRAFLVVVGIEASPQELDAAAQSLAAWRQLPGASNETARAQLIWVLLNHNDFVTLR